MSYLDQKGQATVKWVSKKEKKDSLGPRQLSINKLLKDHMLLFLSYNIPLMQNHITMLSFPVNEPRLLHTQRPSEHGNIYSNTEKGHGYSIAEE